MTGDDYPFDLGPLSWPVGTAVPACQTWMDRGMGWLWGYNHEEAAACFARAAEADPACPMPHWGTAYALGPNYNLDWTLLEPGDLTAMLTAARAALAGAEARAGRAAPLEQALIAALARRLPQDAAAGADALQAWAGDYADAMRAVHAAHPDDATVTALFAEALMNRFPWNMWDLATGLPTPGADTLEARALLEGAIARARAAGRPHPGLWHLYIHLMEMSPDPEAALDVARELPALAPDAGHLLHMPTHIDMLCGRYDRVVSGNEAGIAADLRYVDHAGEMNFYTLYRVHNYHFRQYGAMFLGRAEPAIATAAEMRATIPDALLRQTAPPLADWLEPYCAIGTEALMRFGRWQALVEADLPDEPELFAVTTAMTLFGRALGLANLHRAHEARRAQEDFRAATARVPETRMLHTVPSLRMLAVADAMLAGEIDYHTGNYDAAFTHLRRAVALEDTLPYDEPWGWMMPCRHALGALLLEQGAADEAAAVYEADLGLSTEVIRANRHPDNIWALTGLTEARRRLGDAAGVAALAPALSRARSLADPGIAASCFCARAAG